MGTKYKQAGATLTFANGSGADIAADDVVVTGDTVAIALVDIPDGESGTIAVEGVYEVAKTTGTAWVQGDKLDWDASASEFTKDIATPASGDVEDCGIAAEAAASGDATGLIRLSPGASTVT